MLNFSFIVLADDYQFIFIKDSIATSPHIVVTGLYLLVTF